jgi:hypothetical protein
VTVTPTEWNTRLTVHYTDPNGVEHQISPVTSFTPTFSTTAEALHSIERTHVGVVYSPQALTFSLTVPVIGDAAAKLTAIALQGQRFSISLMEASGDDWSFSTLLLAECIITSASPTPASISGVPQAQFSGFSLHVEATDSANTKTVSPPQSGS